MKKLLYFITLLFIAYSATSQSLNDKWLEQINKGKEAYAIDQYSQALDFFVKAARMIPTDTNAYVYILDCAYKTQNTQVFFDNFDKLLLLNHQSARNYTLAVKMCVEVEKNYQKAVQYIEAAKQNFPENEDIIMADIMLYYEYGDYIAAKKKLYDFIDKYPNTKKAYLLLYNIEYLVNKDNDATLALLEKAQKAFPTDQEFVKMEVNIYVETDQIDIAEQKFRKLIELNPNDAQHYYNLSLIMYNKGDYKTSVDLATKAIELNPDFLDAIFNVGTFFYHMALKYNEALSKMTAYQYTYQGQGRDIELNARAYFEAAKPYFERAVQLNTNELGAFENLNTINALLSNIDTNQYLTNPFFTDLDNEEKHKVYPDYELIDYQLIYPNNQTTLNKGQKAKLIVHVKNNGAQTIDSVELRLIQPFINPMLNYEIVSQLKPIGAGQEIADTVAIEYLMNDPHTLGIEKKEDAPNLIRFFITGTDEKYSDLKEIDVKTGKAPVLVASNNENFSETIDIDFTPNAKAKNYLLVIGIDQYSHWPMLSNAVNDARHIKDVLIEKYQIESQNVYELYNTDATKTNMINELIKIKGELTPQDNLIIYYAGHGDYNAATDQGSWVPADAHLETEDEYLSNSILLSFLNALNTKHTFLIADACFSGSLFVDDDEMTYKPNNDELRSRWGFTSGNIEYVADGQEGQGSPFAQYLAEALTENQRDYIAVTELISYVKFKVRNAALQTPIGRPLKIDGNEGGEFLLYSR